MNIITFPLCAQIQENKIVHSLFERFIAPDSILLKPYTPNEINAFIQQSEAGDLLTGKTIATQINVLNSGSWSTTINGDKICRLLIQAKNAKGLSLYFKQFNLEKGTYLHIYSPDYHQIIGAFTPLNNSENGVFSSQIIRNETLILEYFEPKNTSGTSSLQIQEVGYIFNEKTGLKTASGNCEVNINCLEGDSLQSEKRGVARILIKKGADLFWCSGSLINNTQQNRIPYLLTADHCISGSSTNDILQYQFYFNYESDSCEGVLAKGMLPGNSLQTLTGAKKLANSPIAGGSDFALLLLNNEVPLSYRPYFNGWDISENLEKNGVCIHHPNGDLKKISTFSNTISSVNLIGGMENAYWNTAWTATENGHGVTESGSSGSPLFDSKGYIIGTLSGGLSSCSDLSKTDAYGKISYHWDKVGTDSSARLINWLDPTFTGLKTLHGLDSTVIETPDTIQYNFDVVVFNIPITNNTLTLKITNSKSTLYTIQLTDITGKLILNDSKTIAFNETLSYPLTKKPSGVYFLRVFNNNYNKVKPILILYD